MGKKISDPIHLKNRILLCTYVFRSSPTQFFKAIAKDKVEQESIRSAIKMLMRDKLILKKQALHKLEFIYLSKTGFEFVTKDLLKNDGIPFYKYRTDRSLRANVGEHTFMNFVFIWDWIKNNPNLLNNRIKIYEDSNLNNCKLAFSFAGKDIVISPDVLIEIINEQNNTFKQVILVENDTGGETYFKIYQKLIEYCLLVSKGFGQNLISQAQVYFIFRSQNRLQQFVSKEGIVKFFNYYNSSVKAKDVTIDVFLKAFDGQTLPLFVSAINQSGGVDLYNFESLNLKELILERRPEWKHLL